MRKALALSAAFALAGVTLVGCSSSDSDSTSSESPMVGGMTECTKEAVQPAVDQAAQALGAENQMPIDDLMCADGWAVAVGVLGPKDAPADGPQGAPTAFIFQQEGQFWIPKDAAQVCGTSESDAEVPADLYTAACETI
jgi:hypothetical protein